MKIRTGVALASIVASITTPACGGDDKADAPAAKQAEGEGPGGGKPLLGIAPEKWQCDVLATEADVGGALGGPARRVDGTFPTPRGVAAPCHYVVARGEVMTDAGPVAAEEPWSFDLDCRKDYEKTAATLFAQYAQQSADNVASYQAAAGAPGKKKALTNDAGVPLRAPGGAFEVPVGRKAIDHGGVALLFLDDDAPCYVRVNGPDPARRLALAELVAGRLKEANAPMLPHADPIMK